MFAKCANNSTLWSIWSKPCLDAGLFGRVWMLGDLWRSVVWVFYSTGWDAGDCQVSGEGRTDTEFPVRKETARKSRVMIGAWGKLFARFNLLLLCFSSHSLYPTGQFSGGPFIIQGRLCPVSRLPSRSPVRVCCTARGIDVLGLGAAGASGKQWSVAGFMHPIRLGWHTDRNLRPQ